jgi:RNA polymerase sigma-70 factor (ECF subfamily)
MFGAAMKDGLRSSFKRDAALPSSENARAMPATDALRQIQERLLVLCAQEGNRDAFSRLVDLYDRRLLYFVRRILGDPDGALDVLQSVWLNVHRKLGKLRSPDAFRVWLYRIAHDEAISELRRKTRRPVLIEHVETLQSVDETSIEATAFDNVELVHRALQDLSVDHRRVLTLRFLEDMSIEEIADVIGLSSGTVKSRLHYAKLALRRRIEELTDA